MFHLLFLINISLGEQHVGYKCLDFPSVKLSVVGGRPFSCGGDRLFRPKLLSKWLVRDMITNTYIWLLTFLFGNLTFLCHFLEFILRFYNILGIMDTTYQPRNKLSELFFHQLHFMHAITPIFMCVPLGCRIPKHSHTDLLHTFDDTVGRINTSN